MESYDRDLHRLMILIEVDIDSGDRSRPTFISAKLDSECKRQLTNLLKEYKDCFAWDYIEMRGLDRSIAEHRLPIKSGFWPHSSKHTDVTLIFFLILRPK